MVNWHRVQVYGVVGALLFGANLLPRPVRAADEGGEKVYQRTLRSTVWVIVPIGTKGSARGTGSLVNHKLGLILTNYHVVGKREQALVLFPIFEKNGQVVAERSAYLKKATPVRGKVVHTDPKKDLALIQVEKVPEGAKELPIATKSPTPGQRLHSIGNPAASEALWVYTQGTVRQVYNRKIQYGGEDGFEVDAKIVETQSPVNSGDSGGPVVNDRGELVAVTQGHVNDAQARLVSIFIDVSEVRQLLQSKKVAVRSLPPDKSPVEVAEDKKPDKTEDSPAEKAEKDAARLYKLAKRFADDGIADSARSRCRQIIDMYPKTKAAEDARQLLEKLKK